MPGHDVADLVPKHARHLPGRREAIEQTRRHEHLSARQSKGVDRLIVVEQMKLKLIRRPPGGGRMDDAISHFEHAIALANIVHFAAVLGFHLGAKPAGRVESRR